MQDNCGQQFSAVVNNPIIDNCNCSAYSYFPLQRSFASTFRIRHIPAPLITAMHIL